MKSNRVLLLPFVLLTSCGKASFEVAEIQDLEIVPQEKMLNKFQTEASFKIHFDRVDSAGSLSLQPMPLENPKDGSTTTSNAVKFGVWGLGQISASTKSSTPQRISAHFALESEASKACAKTALRANSEGRQLDISGLGAFAVITDTCDGGVVSSESSDRPVKCDGTTRSPSLDRSVVIFSKVLSCKIGGASVTPIIENPTPTAPVEPNL